MSKDSVGSLLNQIIDDAAVASRVAAGDFSDASGSELTAPEQDLLRAAAAELDDDVVGFGNFDDVLSGQIDGYHRMPTDNVITVQICHQLRSTGRPDLANAFEYVGH